MDLFRREAREGRYYQYDALRPDLEGAEPAGDNGTAYSSAAGGASRTPKTVSIADTEDREQLRGRSIASIADIEAGSQNGSSFAKCVPAIFVVAFCASVLVGFLIGRVSYYKAPVVPLIPRHFVFVFFFDFDRFLDVKEDNSLTTLLDSSDPRYQALPDFDKARVDAVRGIVEVNGPTSVRYLNDADCQEAMRLTYHEIGLDLRPKYSSTEEYMYKSDYCRAAYLYIHGGYYWDTDLVTTDQRIIDLIRDDTDLAVPYSAHQGEVNPAFLATVPRHPLLVLSIQWMIRQDPAFYPIVLSFADATKQIQKDPTAFPNMQFFQEAAIDDPKSEKYEYIDAGENNCNLATFDPESHKILFWERLPGEGCG